jgi:membrane protein YdbS with pleckstrin-like domain
VNLPAPIHPSAHIGFYTAVMNFLLGIGILQIIILALRLSARSPIRRIAETVGNLTFWLGAVVIANVFLLTGTLNGWFKFWSALVVLIGVSLIAQFFVYFARRHFRGREQITQ